MKTSTFIVLRSVSPLDVYNNRQCTTVLGLVGYLVLDKPYFTDVREVRYDGESKGIWFKWDRKQETASLDYNGTWLNEMREYFTEDADRIPQFVTQPRGEDGKIDKKAQKEIKAAIEEDPSVAALEVAIAINAELVRLLRGIDNDLPQTQITTFEGKGRRYNVVDGSLVRADNTPRPRRSNNYNVDM